MRNRLLALLASALFFLNACGAADAPSQLEARKPKPRYPVILHHGFLGFDRILFFDYFFDVARDLQAKGYVVRATRVSPVNTIATRAAQLAPQIDRALAETGADKVTIVAHSMGGLDARYLISSMGYGDRVAALVTIATPHGGTPVADLASTVVGEGKKLKDALLKLFLGGDAEFTAEESLALGLPVDVDGALHDLTTTYQRDFDRANPDDPRVVYESWTGHSTITGAGEPDAVDPLLYPTYAYLRAKIGDNDGLVPVESARHGIDRGLIPADHIDEVGQLFGRVSSDFKYREFYERIVGELAERRL